MGLRREQQYYLLDAAAGNAEGGDMKRNPKPGRERTPEELIRELRDIARIGIVNARRDTEIINQAADMIEAQDERISIMRESMEAMEKIIDKKYITVTDGMMQTLRQVDSADEDDRKSSGLIEEE